MAQGPSIRFCFVGYGSWLLQKMDVLREQSRFCDVTVHVDMLTFQGHRVVLAASSSFLRDQFLLKDSTEATLSVAQKPEVALELLRSCYTGVLEFPLKELIHYLTAASYLQMSHVVEKCQQAASQYVEPSFSLGDIDLGQENDHDPDLSSSSEGMDQEAAETRPRKHRARAIAESPERPKIEWKAEPCEVSEQESSALSPLPGQARSPVTSEWVSAEDLLVMNNELEFQGLHPPPDLPARDETEKGPPEGLLKGPYHCRVCSQVFRLLEKYVSHMREHKVSLCLRCGKTFSQKVNLKRHVRSHMGFKPYQCQLCQKVFSQKVSLQDHLNLHSGARPHRCSCCDMQFTHKPALRRHLRECHGKSAVDSFSLEIQEVVL